MVAKSVNVVSIINILSPISPNSMAGTDKIAPAMSTHRSGTEGVILMFVRVESGDFYSGTFMVICTSAYSDPEKAVYENNTDISPKDLEFTDTTIGSYPAKRAEWTEKTDDGSEMRYVFYGIDVKETVITVKLSTTHSEHVPEMSIEELDEFFADTLDTFKYN